MISDTVETPKSVQENFAKLIQSCQDAVVFIDAEANISFFNRAAQRMFGYESGDVHGENVRLLMPEPYRSEHDGYLQNYRSTGNARAIGRIRRVQAKRANGEVFPIELSVTELHINAHVRFGAFIRDMSEATRRNRELVEQERRSAVGLSSAVFAHEVGNPLNNMLLHAQLLERDLTKAGHPLVDSAAVVTEELRRLARLLDEFREYGQPPDLHREAVDLRELIESTVHHHLVMEGKSHVRIQLELDANLPTVDASRDKLQQVLLNLGKNAIEAMPGGGVLTIGARLKDDAIEVAVSDTGVGISPETDVFQPFKTTKAKGTGLGLPLVEQIVRMHGGSVSYTTEQNKGTTFVVRLPTLAVR